MKRNKVYTIALTGGPCSGKSSALTYLRAKLEDLGYFVITVPEAATQCITSGFHPFYKHMTPELLQQLIIGTGVFNEKMMLEGAWEIAEFMPVVIIYDRGIADSLAYIDKSDFAQQLGRHDIKTGDIFGRYRAVVHMVSAAIGAEDFYTTANNEARTETLEEAQALDTKTLNAWNGHPRLETIDNSTGFDAKLARVFAAVCKHIELPYPVGCDRKFLVKCDILALPEHPVTHVRQRYLKQKDGQTMRIRQRTLDGKTVCTKAWKRTVTGTMVYTHDIISLSEFDSLSLFSDTAEVEKYRTNICFQETILDSF